MKKNISKNQIDKALIQTLKESNKVQESWFGNLFKEDYEVYSEDLREIMEDLVNNVYYDKNLITNIRELYQNIQNSNMDRRDKRELLDIMYGIYQTLEESKVKLERYIRRLDRLK